MQSRKAGRPQSEAAAAHDRIMDAVYALLETTPARDVTMEAVAKLAGVGKPTLYKWWPSKAALILAMFSERLALPTSPAEGETVEATVRASVCRLISLFKGLFGKVMGDLIAEGQSDPRILHDLYTEHIMPRRERLAAQIERAKARGEFAQDVDPELAVDVIFGTVYHRFLLRIEPFDEAFGNALVTHVFSGLRPR